jgi:hypothetical protein
MTIDQLAIDGGLGLTICEQNQFRTREFLAPGTGRGDGVVATPNRCVSEEVIVEPAVGANEGERRGPQPVQ